MNRLLFLFLTLIAISAAAPVKDDPKPPKPLSDAAKKVEKAEKDLINSFNKEYTEFESKYPVGDVAAVRAAFRAEEKAEQKAKDDKNKSKVTIAPVTLSAAAQRLKKAAAELKAAQEIKLAALNKQEEKKVVKEVNNYNKEVEASKKKIKDESKVKPLSEAAKKHLRELHALNNSFNKERTALINKHTAEVIAEVKADEVAEKMAKYNKDNKSKVTVAPVILSPTAKALRTALLELKAVQDFKRKTFIEQADSKALKEVKQYEKDVIADYRTMEEQAKLRKPLSDAAKKHKKAYDDLVSSFKKEYQLMEDGHKQGAIAEVKAEEKAIQKAKDAKNKSKVTPAPVVLSNQAQKLKKALTELKKTQATKLETFRKSEGKALKELRQFEKDNKAYKQQQEEAAKNKKG